MADRILHIADEDDVAEPSMVDVIDVLCDASAGAEARREAALAAEILSVEDEHRDQFRDALRLYVDAYRDSQDPADLVAVGSAIRKLVAIMRPEDIHDAGELLQSGNRAAVSLDIELEVTKSICWNLSMNPPRLPDAHPELAAQFLDLVTTYANDRLLPRPKYAVVLSHSALALMILRSHVGQVLECLQGISLTWFNELIARRADRLREDLLRRGDQDSVSEIVAALEELTSQMTREG
ncbi:MAG: hypothetical protein N2C14_00835 [Planctomycetales bacterium]